MAQEAEPLFNFYFRYTWDQYDFSNWQSGMVNLQRGAMEGTFGAAVLEGFDVSAVSGMVLQVATGIAVGATGYLMVENSVTNLTFTPPVTEPRYDLIVVRPLITPAVNIPNPDPTSPSFGMPVPLQELQDCQVLIIQGTESASPDYPSTLTGDAIICGVFLTAGMSVFPDPKYFMDTNKRDIMGRNSLFQQNFGRYDDRLRPYKNTFNSMGIKPSQLIHPNSRAFSFVNKTMPSIFPKTGGLYTHADTFMNFLTGAVTGGDGTTGSFTPTIPGANTYINASVFLTTSDTLQVVYGTQGTLQQCLDGISNQTAAASAGGVGSVSNAKLLMIVTVGSIDGVNITTLQYVDARGLTAIGSVLGVGSQGYTLLTGNYNMQASDDGKIFGVSTATGAFSMKFPSPSAGFKVTFKDISGQANSNNITFTQFSAEKIEGLAQSYVVASPWWEGTWFTNGTDWFRMI